MGCNKKCCWGLGVGVRIERGFGSWLTGHPYSNGSICSSPLQLLRMCYIGIRTMGRTWCCAFIEIVWDIGARFSRTVVSLGASEIPGP